MKGDKGYRWRSGLEIGNTEIPIIPKELYDRLPKSSKVQKIPEAQSNLSMFAQGSRDRDLFYVACCLLRGKMPADKIYQSLMALARSCNPPFSLKEAEQKVSSAMKQAAEEPRDFAAEVSQLVLLQDGAFRIDSIFNELAALTKEQKAQCRNAVLDLKKRGIVEPEKGIGTYRLVNKAIEYIQIPDETADPLNIKWPFYLEDYCDIYPGNIAVIAGTSNAGKSIFCINFAKKNLGKHKIRYQSSEMDGHELKMRLDGFGVDISDLREQVEWIRRGSEWWDLIVPDGINIIDFMEIYGEFYDVGKWIKLIFDRLTTGMALIALQKKDSRTDDGRGGALTREKARLYLSMNYGELKIVKAKNWHTDKDPNGMNIGFEVERGVILKNTTPWERAND